MWEGIYATRVLESLKARRGCQIPVSGVSDDCEQFDMYAGNWTQVLCANSPVPQTTDFECRQQSYMENTAIFLGFQSYRRTVNSYLQLFKHEVTFG